MRYCLYIICILLVFSCKDKSQNETIKLNEETVMKEVDSILNKWHKAAATADFDSYFNLMTSDAIFIGTDATENWNYQEFKEFCKPYFDNKQTWDFKSLDRNIFLGEESNVVWFDELLDTQMKICRGSGVLKKENNTWKIAHYVLSIAVPNENVNELILLKNNTDSLLIEKLKNNSKK